MEAKFNIDDYVYIKGKVTEINVSPDGTFYQVRIAPTSGSTIINFEEDDLHEVTTTTTETTE